MTNRLMKMLILLMALAVTGCPGPDNGSGTTASPDTNASRKWTYMVYMGGDNNLSSAGLVDLNEMEKVGSTNEVAIALQAEFSNKYGVSVPTDTRRFLVQKDNNDNDANLGAGTSIGNVNMADPATLTSFIQWAKQTYPAEHYALIIWDHGAGWKERSLKASGVLRGAVQDETSNGSALMTLPDLAKGVRDSGVHFDIVNFDACLMAMYEVAYEFKGLTDYMVFSEEVEPGEGDPYDTILSDLTTNPAMSSGTLASTIVAKYNASYSTNDRAKTTKSAVDMSQMDALDAKVVELANALQNDSSAGTLVQQARSQTQDYGYKSNHDIYDLCKYINDNLPSGTAKAVASDIMSLIGSIVINNKTTGSQVANSHGLAIYLPLESEVEGSDLNNYSQLACNQTRSSASGTWGAFVDSMITAGGGGTVQSGTGDFGIYLYWTDVNGNACDADLDLYVQEPAGDYATTGNTELYAPWMGQSTPNGFFSQDSADAGQSLEYYVANSQVYKGEYTFAVNYWKDGSTCTSAMAHLLYKDPANGVNDWTEIGNRTMDLSNPAPGTCTTLSCSNLYSDLWGPGSLVRSTGSGTFIRGGDLPLSSTKRSQLIFKYKKGSRLYWRR